MADLPAQVALLRLPMLTDGGFDVFDLFPMASHEPKPFGGSYVEEKK
jgi:hypothetical protein